MTKNVCDDCMEYTETRWKSIGNPYLHSGANLCKKCWVKHYRWENIGKKRKPNFPKLGW